MDYHALKTTICCFPGNFDDHSSSNIACCMLFLRNRMTQPGLDGGFEKQDIKKTRRAPHNSD